MATAATSSTGILEGIKTIYDESNPQISNELTLLKLIKKNTKAFVGPTHRVFLEYTRGTGIGNRAELEDLPAAGFRPVKYVDLSPKRIYGVTEFSGDVMELMDTDKSSFKAQVGYQLEGLREDFKVNLNRQLYSDGSGVIAQINGNVSSSATVVLNNPTVGETATQHLYPGQRIDVWSAKTAGSKQVDSAVIQSVDSDTQITLTATTSITDDYYLYYEDSRNLDVTGMLAAIDDGGIKDNYFGVTRTSNRWFQSLDFNNSGTPRNLTTALINIAVARVRKEAMIDTMVVNHTPFNTLANAATDGVRFNRSGTETEKLSPMSISYDLTSDYLMVGNVKLYADKDCPSGHLFGFKGSNLHWYSKGDAKFWDKDGSMYRQIAGKDGVSCFLVQRGELINVRPNASFVIRDLQ